MWHTVVNTYLFCLDDIIVLYYNILCYIILHYSQGTFIIENISILIIVRSQNITQSTLQSHIGSELYITEIKKEILVTRHYLKSYFLILIRQIAT